MTDLTINVRLPSYHSPIQALISATDTPKQALQQIANDCKCSEVGWDFFFFFFPFVVGYSFTFAPPLLCFADHLKNATSLSLGTIACRLFRSYYLLIFFVFLHSYFTDAHQQWRHSGCTHAVCQIQAGPRRRPRTVATTVCDQCGSAGVRAKRATTASNKTQAPDAKPRDVKRIALDYSMPLVYLVPIIQK